MDLKNVIQKAWKPALAIAIGLGSLRAYNDYNTNYIKVNPEGITTVAYTDGLLGFDRRTLWIDRSADKKSAVVCSVEQRTENLGLGHSYLIAFDNNCNGTVDRISASWYLQTQALPFRAAQLLEETRQDERFAQYLPSEH